MSTCVYECEECGCDQVFEGNSADLKETVVCNECGGTARWTEVSVSQDIIDSDEDASEPLHDIDENEND